MVTPPGLGPGSTGLQVPNMHSDRNAKEPGSLVWQSEHKLICSDDHTVTLPSLSGSAPLRFMHKGIPRASTTCTSPIQSAPDTSASPIYGVCHTGVNLPGGHTVLQARLQ